MRGIVLRASLAALIPALLTGCGTTRSCGGDAEYLTAVDRPRLVLPEGLRASERISPMVIPPAAPDAARLDPAPACLDEPPAYFARKGAVADSAEEAVNAWARAWAERKPEPVLQSYSRSFEATGEGGSAAFLDRRRQQVETGQAPSAQLEEVTVQRSGADRRVVTFVQRFGEGGVRKELTLVRENGNWRILSERTLEVL